MVVVVVVVVLVGVGGGGGGERQVAALRTELYLEAGTWKAENPRSSVMPRCFSCGFLSAELVEKIVERLIERDVLPLST